MHNANKYIILTFFLSGKHRKTAELIREFYVVNNLDINMLLSNDILVLKDFLIIYLRRCVIIGLYKELEVPIKVKIKSTYKVNRVILS